MESVLFDIEADALPDELEIFDDEVLEILLDHVDFFNVDEEDGADVFAELYVVDELFEIPMLAVERVSDENRDANAVELELGVRDAIDEVELW